MPLILETPKLCFQCGGPLVEQDEAELQICRSCLPPKVERVPHACGVCGMWTENSGVCSACHALDLIASPADRALAGALRMLRVRS